LEVRLAAQKGVYLEITSRSGHSLTNGHVARLAAEQGAHLVVNTDTHAPEDLVTRERAFKVLLGAGLTERQAQQVLENNARLLARLKELISES